MFDAPAFSYELGPPEFLNALMAVLIYTTGLVHFSIPMQPMPSNVLAVLQHPGRSSLELLGAALVTDVPGTIRHISRFSSLRELNLWLHKIADVDGLMNVDAPAWTLPCLVQLIVHMAGANRSHEQEMLRFLVRCSFTRLEIFAWLNLDSVAHWETQVLTDFLRRNVVLEHLTLRIIDIQGLALARVLAGTTCPLVSVMAPYLAEEPLGNPLSPRIEALALDCHWGDDSREDMVLGLWRLLDAILQYHKDTDALREIMIWRIAEEGPLFG
jgi:hypothetical protein